MLAQSHPAPTIALPPGLGAGLDEDVTAVLRANLHAAARHTFLGHEAPTFRECSHPECLDAVREVPPLEALTEAATEAELDAILDRLQAAR